MSTFQRSSSPIVALPSIQEMFPEHLMQVPPHMRLSRAPPQLIFPHIPRQTSRSNPISDQNRPRSLSSSANRTEYRASFRRNSLRESPRMPHAMPRAPHPPSASPTTAFSTTRGFHSHPDGLDTQSAKESASLPTHSFGVLRSDPSSSSLQHINSSPTYSNRGGSSHGHHSQAGLSNGSTPVFQVTINPSAPHPKAPFVDSRHSGSPEQPPRRVESRDAHNTSGMSNYSSIISFPVAGSANGSLSQREYSPDDASNASDDGDISGSNSGKKHVCSTCFKRFNRPSSLRIHVNTHTGATPFRCPWPNCGREFNVNSNMRRHYRNHTTPGFSRSQSNDNRRRRRRAPPQSASRSGGDSVSPTVRMATERQQFIPSPPISSLTMSEDSDDDISDPMEGTYAHEEDELESPNEFSTRQRRGFAHPSSRGMPGRPEHERTASQHFSQSHIRSLRRSPSSPPSSPSPSPPPPSEPFYSPSAPYVRSLADPRVSTALRPAFHSTPLPRKQAVKQEPTSDVW